MIREAGFIKNNISINISLAIRRKAFVSFLIRSIANENTLVGFVVKFVGVIWSQIRVCITSKGFDGLVAGFCLVRFSIGER